MKRCLALAIVLVGCGDDGNHMQPIDAPTGHADATVDTKSIDAPLSDAYGLIEITQGSDDGTAKAGVDVQFSNVLFGQVSGTDGPCTVYGLAQTPRFSAGDISITGTKSPITVNASGTAPDVTYDTATTVPEPAYDAGATIQVSAAGGPDVPAFTATVTGPAALAGYTPPTTVSRSGYTATWTASTASIWVIFAAFDSNSGDGGVGVCRVSDNGSFTIPSSTWALLPATADTAMIGVGRVSPTTVNAGGAMVTVQAVSYVTASNVTLTN